MTIQHEQPSSLPTLAVLVQAADIGLHPWVRDHVPQAVRRAALEVELGFWLNTAARDMNYAIGYAGQAPQIGQPAEAYLDRWIGLDRDAHVLVGPRYLGRDPDLPFVGVSASDRPLTPADREQITAVARDALAAFKPGFVMLTTADPIGAWPDTRPEMRQVVGCLANLRRQQTPAKLSAYPRTDTDFYDRYREIHAAHVLRDPTHARHARCEDRQDLQTLAEHGMLFDVRVDGVWAGIIAGERDTRRGIRGATVIELLLDHKYRGLGYGRHLSTLLAKALPLPSTRTTTRRTAPHSALGAWTSAARS
jgi:GNAT superfamily N-acetyltransferase